MILNLIDINKKLTDAWKDTFEGTPVNVIHGNIFDHLKECVVSPSNSYGWMNGGIDMLYCNHFGGIETKVQQQIQNRFNGKLKVGSAMLVETGNSKTPYMIVAPTMEFPGVVPKQNCYKAMRAILDLLRQSPVSNVYCPGLGTAMGGVAAIDCAIEMRKAYDHWATINKMLD